MCSRVVVIHKGSIRASDTAENLLKNHRSAGQVRFEARDTGPEAREALLQLGGVKDVSEEQDGEYKIFTLRTDANADPSEDLLRLAGDRRWRVREVTRRRPTLEDIFVDLTLSDN
jgi:ABC-2 type transport system ATP-binding protein